MTIRHNLSTQLTSGLALLVAIAVLLGPGQSAAQPAPTRSLVERGADHWGENILSLELATGITPVGFWSASVQLSPASWLTVDASLGAFAGDVIPALEIRFRLPLDHWATYLGAGVTWWDTDRPGPGMWFVAAGGEHRWDSGISIRFWLGVGSAQFDDIAMMIPTTGVGVGYALF